jgi:methionyl-tRNA synthetase
VPLSTGDFARQYEEETTTGSLSLRATLAVNLVSAVDQHIDRTQPFKLAKDESRQHEVPGIMYDCIEALRIASVLLWPFIPDACEAFWQRIGCGHYVDALAHGGRGSLAEWTRWGQLQPGTKIEKGPPLFPRYQPPKS